MPVVKNSCRGQYASFDITASDADIAVITGMLEGVVSVYEEKGAGGTDCPTPSKFRQFKFGVNRAMDNLRCTVTLKHVKVGKNEIDIFAQKPLFDADWTHTLKATGMRMIYGGER